MTDIPLCACGCGQPVNFFQGKPYKYLKNHNKRSKPKNIEIPDDFQWYDREKKILSKSPPFRLGFCCCDNCIDKDTPIDIATGGFLRRYKLNHHQKKGRENQNWKGGEFLNEDYPYILRRHHPNATKQGYILKSRYYMELELGRYLTKEEVVHHIDKNPRNNDISNLKLYSSQGEHIGTEHNPRRDTSGRFCQQCLSTVTAKEKKKGQLYDKWFFNPNGEGFICRKCYDKNNWLKKQKKK